MGTSPVVPQLRLHAPNAGGPSSIPGRGTRSHVPQLKSLHATTKNLVCRNQDPVQPNKNKYLNVNK